jgi:serine protease
MEESNGTTMGGAPEGAPRKRGNVFWILLILAVVLVWWWWRAPRDNGTSAGAGADAASLAEADPDDILVDLRDDTSPETLARLERELGLDLVLVSRQAEDERFYRAHVEPARRDEILAELARRPEVELAEPDAEMHLIQAEDPDGRWKGFPNDPLYRHQWHLRQIGADRAWKLADGKGVIVAVIDTGVAYEDHKRFHRVPDLANTRFVKGYDFVNDHEHANDDHGHGTHVAGTIAQSTHNGVGVAGVAYGATIMPLKVLTAQGSGSVAGIVDAIRYAADNGAKVINMSLGGRFPSKLMEKAVKYAHDKGVVVVCAAGNDGRGRVSYPAAYPGSVAVAATQYDESTTFYSNWGKEIDVAAPGGNTQVDQDKDGRPDGVLQNTITIGDPTHDGYYAFMGTSMAAPHVAGVAALVVAQGVANPDQVEKVLKETARGPKDRQLARDRYGAGIVDAPAAVKQARGGKRSWPLGLGLLMAGAVAASARRRGLGVRLGPTYLVGVLLGAGALILPGFPSWDLTVLGPAGHGNALFFSALAPIALVAAGYGIRRLRAPLAGFAAGVAAHLVFHAVVPMVGIQWVPFDPLWLVLNAALCLGLATLVLRE